MIRLLLAAFLALTAASAAGAEKPVVPVDGGAIRGERLADRVVFRGVPFAAPPTGALRWRPPAPVAAWRGVRDATRSAPSCAQLDDGWNKANAANSSEDCLYLEVATPSLVPARPLPVFVWIHGGSNRAGGAAGTVTSPLLRRGIVLVSIQYRLGPLGFMAHPALSAESLTHRSGNWALMDQQAALRWVASNIARFGGDPARVTIGGESAGAMDVALQQLSPRARGLFRAAIQESGTAGFGMPPRDLAASEAIGEAIAAAAGHPRADGATLRAIPPAALLDAARRIAVARLPDIGALWLQAQVDGEVIIRAPGEALADGDGARVPLLIGTNAREFSFAHDAAAARDMLPALFGRRADMAARVYGLSGGVRADPLRGEVGLRLGTDTIFACPTGFTADARARAGVPVWAYQVRYDPPGGPALGHASELRYVFGNPGEGGIAADAPPLGAYWANFIRSGDPNGAGLATWPGYDARRRYLAFGAGMPIAGAGLISAACAGWDRP